MSNGLHSWGRFPYTPQVGHSRSWRSELPALLEDVAARHGSTLPFGNGRSYGDSCLAASGNVIHTAGLSRFIEVDWSSGLIRAESGITLSEILAVAIPHGWFLSVTPGTQFVTLGGALANDVHGKNHHVKGTFGKHVRQLGLLRSDLGETICSPTQHPDLFRSTIGGLGLTGVITWAEIQLQPIRSSQINTSTVRFNNLREFFALSNELDHAHEYSVAWIDCLAKGHKSGRGVFIVGDHAPYGTLEVDSRSKLTVPFAPPISLINKVSLHPFNELYWRAHPARRTIGRSGYDPFFYPLDRLLHWNRIYGRKGFQQYQCVIPEAAAEQAVAQLLRAIADSGEGSFLAVLKRCGDIQSPGLLSFPLPGASLALDFPQNRNLEKTLFPRLDSIVREAAGRLYPAKDAHMTAADFRSGYPDWELLDALRDPLLISSFWKRVTA